MRSTSTNSYHSVPSIESVEKEQAFQPLLGMSAYRQQASRAGKMKAIFEQSYAQNYMIFQQFMKPGTRNRILRENSREPILTQFDPKPRRLKRRNTQPTH